MSGDTLELTASLAGPDGPEPAESASDAAASGEQLDPLAVTTPLTAAAPAPAVRDESQSLRGRTIGRYTVLSKLGAGAMGLVLAAYDPELDRKVALKLLRPGTGNRAGARQRLQREAQALAKLDHRNVVAVHDVGEHEGRLFVAMEFVAGRTLGAWMQAKDEARTWREVLTVFVAAGRGLAAAHAGGLIHRDFKPENVMLGDDGRVRVMDFGLARMGLDDASQDIIEVDEDELTRSDDRALISPLTQTGMIMGTPAYMAPEQIRADPVDARSDQFSFCVALFEALHGQRPFSGRSLGELAKAIARGPTMPRNTAVPSWLQAVLARGLAPDPEARWPSMDALLEALEHDPALRRRRWAAGSLALALVAGAAWGVVTLSHDEDSCAAMDDHLRGIWDDARRSEVEAALLETGLGHAAQTWARIGPSLDAYAADWVAARRQACEASQRGEQSDALLDRRMACLDERLQHLHATVDILARADETTANKAVEAVAGLPSLARCADAKALLAERPPPEDPRLAAAQAELDERLVTIATLERAGHYADGLTEIEGVVTQAEPLGLEPLMARIWLLQGRLRGRASDPEGARAALEKAYDAALVQGMAHEASWASSQLVFELGYRLAQTEEGRRWARHAEPLSRASGRAEDRVRYLQNLGTVSLVEGRYDDAVALYHQALDEQQRGGLGELTRVVPLNNLGSVSLAREDHEGGERFLLEALAIEERILGPDHPNVGLDLANLGLVAQDHGDLDLARERLERALALLERAHAKPTSDMAGLHNNLGTVASKQGREDEAREHLQQALEIWEETLGPEHPFVAMPLGNLCGMAIDARQLDQASELCERAFVLNERAYGPDHIEVAHVHIWLGNIAGDRGEQDAAWDHYHRALEIAEKAAGPESVTTGRAARGLGGVLLERGLAGEALPWLERANTILHAEAQDEAAADFSLAQALWDAPKDAGRDRPRSRSLAESARAGLAEKPGLFRDDIDRWLAEHPAPN